MARIQFCHGKCIRSKSTEINSTAIFSFSILDPEPREEVKPCPVLALVWLISEPRPSSNATELVVLAIILPILLVFGWPLSKMKANFPDQYRKPSKLDNWEIVLAAAKYVRNECEEWNEGLCAWKEWYRSHFITCTFICFSLKAMQLFLRW